MFKPTDIAVIRNASFGISERFNPRGYLLYWSYAKDLTDTDHLRYGHVDSWRTYPTIKKAIEHARSKNSDCTVLRQKNDDITQYDLLLV